MTPLDLHSHHLLDVVKVVDFTFPVSLFKPLMGREWNWVFPRVTRVKWVYILLLCYLHQMRHPHSSLSFSSTFHDEVSIKSETEKKNIVTDIWLFSKTVCCWWRTCGNSFPFVFQFNTSRVRNKSRFTVKACKLFHSSSEMRLSLTEDSFMALFDDKTRSLTVNATNDVNDPITQLVLKSSPGFNGIWNFIYSTLLKFLLFNVIIVSEEWRPLYSFVIKTTKHSKNLRTKL